MRHTSPSAAGLLADYRNAAVGHETPILVTWLDAGQTALISRKRYLTLGTDFGHDSFQRLRSVISVSVESLY